MQAPAKNQYLENLCLSYMLYQNHIRRLHDFLKDKNYSGEVLLAAKKLQLVYNYYAVRNFNINLRDLAGYYNVAVKFDWSQFFNYFDLLDALIIHKHADSALGSYCEIIKTVSDDDVVYSNFHFVTKIALSKLSKLTGRIVIEHYRDQYSINHYFNMDLNTFNETNFLNEEMVYLYFLKGQEQSVINDYIDLDSKCQALKENAQFYFNAATTLSFEMREKYGPDVVPVLAAVWIASYLHRINSMEQIKKAQVDCIERSGLPVYNPDIQDFFCFSELIESWCQYQDRPDYGNRICFTDPRHCESVIDQVVAEYGLGLEDDIRKLYCFLVPISALAIEYLALQFYAITGDKTNLANRYRDSAQHFRTKVFADG